MNYSPKLPTIQPEGVREPFAGGTVSYALQAGKGDLSDWVELMEVVEALCPVWPERSERRDGSDWRL